MADGKASILETYSDELLKEIEEDMKNLQKQELQKLDSNTQLTIKG